MKNEAGTDDLESVKNKMTRLAPRLFKIYLPPVIFLGGIGALKVVADVDIGMLTRDPVQIMDGRPYYGLLSNVGVLLWSAAATICLFSYFLANASHEKNKFLLHSFYITMLLMIDDFFLFHEIVLPEYFYIPEKLVYLAYAFFMMIYVLKNWVNILKTEYPILMLAFLFFGLSVTVDMMPVILPGQILLEDGAKFMGIVSWLSFFVDTCQKAVMSKKTQNDSLCVNGGPLKGGRE